MNRSSAKRLLLALWLAPLAYVMAAPPSSRAAVVDSGARKAPEVSTVGSGPYPGPLPEELTKLAEQPKPALSSPVKEPVRSTIAPAGRTLLTDAEQAKLTALRAVVVTLPILLMPKLEPMVITKEGTPALSPQERAKHAAEGNTPAPPSPVPAASPVKRSDR